MKTIFKKIEGREWDWFGYPKSGWVVERNGILNESTRVRIDYRTLADLLANKSWCIAVWGKGKMKWNEPTINWRENSASAFQILQQNGEEAAIKYIKESMK